MYENILNLFLFKKLMSVLAWGIINTIPCIALSEFIRNKYLILCIPFVLNYFISTFLSGILPYKVMKYINPGNYQSVFLMEKETWIPCVGILSVIVISCIVLKKVLFERRCDCGQQ